MYQRFLNNNDYISIVTEEALKQLIRGNEERLAQAEEAAEQSVIEYLTDNYEVEKALAVGKNLLPYNTQITYPAGSHFYHDGKIFQAIRPIACAKRPSLGTYWEPVTDFVDPNLVKPYSQTLDYMPGDIVSIGNEYWKSLSYNGYHYGDIRYPGIDGWMEVGFVEWNSMVEYEIWKDVVRYNGEFYVLINSEGVDFSINPEDSECWGKIGEYSEEYEYEFSDKEYVVFKDKVLVPAMNVNADKLIEGYNIMASDPRNANLKKHILRLAVYELHKLISPNNISSARITDYETSITWLRDASRLKINPQIPRKIDEERKEVTEYAIATFARDYDPNKNPWQV